MSERCQEIELGRQCVLSDGHAEEHDFGWLSAGARPAPGGETIEDAKLADSLLPDVAAGIVTAREVLRAAERCCDTCHVSVSEQIRPFLSALPGAAASGREDDWLHRMLLQAQTDHTNATDEVMRAHYNGQVVALLAVRARSAPRPGRPVDRQPTGGVRI